MTRFLYLIGSLGSGGSERQLTYLVRALRLDGHPVTVAVWNYNDRDTYVEAIRATGAVLVALSGSTPGRLRQLRRIIREHSITIVHSYTFYLNPIVAAATLGTPARAVGSVRSTLSSAVELTGSVAGPLAARYPRRQVYNNGSAVREAERKKFFRPSQIALVPNHLAIDDFPERDLPLAPRIAGVGSLLPYKRWDRLIGACARLRDAGVDAHLTIAGDGPLRTELEREIDRLGLAGRVTLLGYVSDVHSVVADSWFLAHTSETEGSPNVVIEALASGRAVVATAVGDVPVLIDEGETGYVVDDADTLYQRMETLLRDREACVRMGRRARHVALQRFGAATIAAETLEAYRMLGCR